ncbi:MAG: MBL fold metallo-hydrolase, partial [Dehalococcoidia bacterium]|nr:MBL fold metallo-hydrolase [Dehalococcoidia bacterium]
AVEEVEAGDSVAVRTLRVHVTPAAHQGVRLPLGPRAPTLGYLVEGSATVYFAGDTDLFDGMRDIPRLVPGGIDLALLPVGGWGPTLRGGHLDPLGAAQALLLLRPRAAMPIHWGTFWPVGMSGIRRDRFEQPGAAFRVAAAQVAPEVQVHLPGLGGAVPVN